ncbi:hypothetical protein NW754_005752 [Fusarium falciforme]|nr:hypothetical protein NW754_005752 [Fusarium falciforme]
MAGQPKSSNNGLAGRLRGVSISVIKANPQLGVWQAAGTAIAQAPNLRELRDPESGGANIAFNVQGHSARFAVQEPDGEIIITHAGVYEERIVVPANGDGVYMSGIKVA